MKKNVLILFLFFGFFTKAQYNLVPNPSFETFSVCPNNAGQITYATGWINPTVKGNSDFFNSCSSVVGVPSYCNCNLSFQYPKSGNGYAGVWAYNSTTSDLREYIQVQLINTLLPSKCYYVEFYLNKLNYCQYATDNVGFILSPTNISLTSNTSYLLYYPNSVKGFQNKMNQDTINWIKSSSIYNSGGGESFLTIGNFNNDIETDTLIVNNNSFGNGAYYFIDDVSVIPIDSIIGGMSAKAGVDKSIAIGDSAFIGQEISNLNCNWYQLPGNVQIATNTSGIYVKPNTTTTYVVEQNLCGTITYDTVKVFASPTTLKDYEALQNIVTIYPNPSDGHISIISKKLSDIVITVTDITGTVLYNEQTKVIASFANFNVNVKAGSYFVTIVNTHTNEKIIKKLIIQ
jgi:hypothetical protein